MVLLTRHRIVPCLGYTTLPGPTDPGPIHEQYEPFLTQKFPGSVGPETDGPGSVAIPLFERPALKLGPCQQNSARSLPETGLINVLAFMGCN